MPINANKIVQVGAKTQEGGLSGDFPNEAYQPEEIAGAVNKEPIAPAISQTIIAMANLKKLFFFISVFQFYRRAVSQKFGGAGHNRGSAEPYANYGIRAHFFRFFRHSLYRGFPRFA